MIKFVYNIHELRNFFDSIEKENLGEGYKIIFEKIKTSRNKQQNRALHLYFTIIANELNNLGLTFNYEGLRGQIIEIPYTDTLVKERIWRPIQIALFKKKSTTKINTSEINKIVEVLTKFFADRGVLITFPSLESLMFKKLKDEKTHRNIHGLL